MSKYTIKYHTDEGGSVQFYHLVESRYLGFKEFYSKKQAQYAYNVQKKLSKLGLAPKVHGKVCKLKVQNWHEKSGWGFITQIVKCGRKQLSRRKIQELVNNIYEKTGLKFWDCHDYNIGIFRNKYVCIDTGKESFDEDCNAWGMNNPGPKCYECNKYECNCYP